MVDIFLKRTLVVLNGRECFDVERSIDTAKVSCTAMFFVRQSEEGLPERGQLSWIAMVIRDKNAFLLSKFHSLFIQEM